MYPWMKNVNWRKRDWSWGMEGGRIGGGEGYMGYGSMMGVPRRCMEISEIFCEISWKSPRQLWEISGNSVGHPGSST